MNHNYLSQSNTDLVYILYIGTLRIIQTVEKNCMKIFPKSKIMLRENYWLEKLTIKKYSNFQNATKFVKKC